MHTEIFIAYSIYASNYLHLLQASWAMGEYVKHIFLCLTAFPTFFFSLLDFNQACFIESTASCGRKYLSLITWVSPFVDFYSIGHLLLLLLYFSSPCTPDDSSKQPFPIPSWLHRCLLCSFMVFLSQAEKEKNWVSLIFPHMKAVSCL